jgi:hypothetical protein
MRSVNISKPSNEEKNGYGNKDGSFDWNMNLVFVPHCHG